MNIMEMTKEDFERVEQAEYGKEYKFESLVIIPTGYKHESGFVCMKYVAVNNVSEPICWFAGGSDVLHIDGIGGYGGKRSGWKPIDSVPPKGWVIDCLPCGYLRLFGPKYLYADSFGLSDFEVIGELTK